MTVRVTVEERFTLALKSLPHDRQKGAIRALAKFATTPNLPGLKLHILRNARNCWIIYVNDKGDRIILRKLADDHYVALDVGPHDNVYRRWDR